jgi:hypothetical protein
MPATTSLHSGTDRKRAQVSMFRVLNVRAITPTMVSAHELALAV